jgi:DNA mismatch repair protein MutS
MLFDEYAEHDARFRSQYGPRSLVLMEVGSFYELYSDEDKVALDIRAVCDLLNIVLTKKNKNVPEVSRSNPMMAGFPSPALSKYLPVLMDHNYTVVLVSQVTPPPNPKRAVTRVYSKGTYLDDLRNTNSSNNLMCIYLEQDGAGVVFAGAAVLDLATGAAWIGEGLSSKTDPESAMDDLYRIVTIHTPVEVVVMAGNRAPAFQSVVRRLDLTAGGACVYDRMGPAFDPNLADPAFQDALLRKVHKGDLHAGILRPIEWLGLERNAWALVAYVGVVQFAFQHDETIIARISRPEAMVRPDALTVCNNTLRQLGVVAYPGQRRTPTLCSILNRCCTPMGRRAFEDRLLSPTADRDVLLDRYDAVEVAVGCHKEVRAALRGVCDLQRTFRKVCLGTARPQDVALTHQSMSAITKLLKECPSASKVMSRNNRHIAETALAELTSSISSMLDVSLTGRNVFIRGAVPDLDALEEDIQSIHAELTSVAEAVNGRLERTDREGFYVVTTTKRFQDAIKRKPSSITCLSEVRSVPTSGSYCRLVHDALSAKTTKLAELTHTLEARLDEEFKAFLGRLAQSHAGTTMRQVVACVMDLDVHSTCAMNAFEYRHCRPALAGNDEGKSSVRFVGVRHPIIERVQDDQLYVPNDFEVGTEDCSGALLYGLNAAGKSSLAKSVGVNVVLAQAGMFVAAEACKLAPYRTLMSRVSTGDDIVMGMSTFTIEMTELRNILRRADAHSLVIGDELCAGTEHNSGLAIVAAGLHSMSRQRASFVFATHLHELPNIPEVKQIPGLRTFHLSVSIDPATGRLKYHRELKPGSGPDTYGIEVCRGLHMPPDFVLMAQKVRHALLGVEHNLVGARRSRYNRKVIVDACAKCGKNAEEVHHVLPQASADDKGFIGHFHKNARHNLVPLCSACHDALHAQCS